MCEASDAMYLSSVGEGDEGINAGPSQCHVGQSTLLLDLALHRKRHVARADAAIAQPPRQLSLRGYSFAVEL